MAQKKAPTTAQLQKQLAVAQAQVFNNLSAALASSFGGPSRLRKNYNQRVGSGDRVLSLDREDLRDTARVLDLTSDLTSGFHDRIVDAVLGVGLRPIPVNPDARALAPKFMRWMDRADHRGILKGGELQRLVFRSSLVDGDILTIKTNQRTVQIAESDQVSSIGNKDNTLIDGVRYDATGRITGYDVYPYSVYGTTPEMNKGRTIAAKDAILLANRKRPSMTRGLPVLHASLDRIADVNELSEAIIVAAKLSACLALIAETDSPGALANVLTNSTTTGGSTSSDGRALSMTNTEPGMLLHAPTGTTVKAHQGTQPGATIDGFLDKLLRFAASGIGFPVEYLMRDNSKANFSVSRMVRLQTEEAALPYRERFTCQWLGPIWRWWVNGEARAGTLGVPLNDALDVEWTKPPLLMLDPQKEVAAAVMAINNNLQSKDDFLIEQGRTFATILDDRKKETEAEAEAGVVPPMPPGSPEASIQDDDDKADPPKDD